MKKPKLSHLSRREFLTRSSLLSAAAVSGLTGCASTGRQVGRQAVSGTAAFNLPDLPYSYDALEPSIDAKTMEIHHSRHHAGYANNFKQALNSASIQLSSPIDIISDINALPRQIQTSVRNNGGGFVNHNLFWEFMAPAGQGGSASPALLRALDKAFGGMDGFRDSFSTSATTSFGSGWAWLIVRPDQSLKVVSTPNQDNPYMRGVVPSGNLGTPILGLDVWEHAYYLHYQNRRAGYIENWWEVVNWEAISQHFAEASA